jgi:hypothetical protein
MFQKYIMNTVVIISVVLILIVLYVTFFVFTGSQSLTAKVDLGSQQTAITADKLSNPGSVRYSYEAWVYVYQFEAGGKYLFSRGSTDQTGSGHKKNIGLRLGQTSPEILLEYKTTVAGNDGFKTLTISNNFPIQTWVHVIVSVDNNYIDVYMNGKLVKSIQATLEAPSIASSIDYGMTKAYLAKFVRNTSPIDPQTAWNNYTSGNGVSSSMSSLLGNYGATIIFNKDAAEYSKFKVF